MVHTTPTAQQAMQVYDDQGELQMLEFLQQNVTPDKPGTDHQQQEQVQTARYTFPDGNYITHHPSHYHFHWTVINRRVRPEDARRPAAVNPGQFPVYEPE